MDSCLFQFREAFLDEVGKSYKLHERLAALLLVTTALMHLVRV